MEEGLCLGKGGEVDVDCVVGVGLGVGLEEVLCGAAWERVGVVREGLCCWGRIVCVVGLRDFVAGEGQCGGWGSLLLGQDSVVVEYLC